MKALAITLCLAAAACVTAADLPAAKELAPEGRLRAALARDDTVSRDVARELARRLRVRLEPTALDAPFDVAFIVPEAARAAQLDFTAPYLILDGRAQVIAVARGRPDAGAYLRDFVDELKAAGFVAAAIERNNAKGRARTP